MIDRHPVVAAARHSHRESIATSDDLTFPSSVDHDAKNNAEDSLGANA